MIERLLIEAELPEETKKLDVLGRSLDGIKELLAFLLRDPHTGKQLKRQVTTHLHDVQMHVDDRC